MEVDGINHNDTSRLRTLEAYRHDLVEISISHGLGCNRNVDDTNDSHVSIVSMILSSVHIIINYCLLSVSRLVVRVPAVSSFIAFSMDKSTAYYAVMLTRRPLQQERS